jgi:hypothetical protein
MLLDAAETVIGYFGFDRSVYGNKKNIGPRKWRWLQEVKYAKKSFKNVLLDFGDTTQRWNWIANSMLPTYQQLDTQNQALVQSDLSSFTPKYFAACPII